jgi:hypothetical protein
VRQTHGRESKARRFSSRGTARFNFGLKDLSIVRDRMLDGDQFKARTCPSFKLAVTYTGDEAEGLLRSASQPVPPGS